jgi:hypothetical protein
MFSGRTTMVDLDPEYLELIGRPEVRLAVVVYFVFWVSLNLMDGQGLMAWLTSE